jgi:inosine triphosphate pyrophosphatase
MPEQVGGPVLTEDTALEFHALKGLPGPYMQVPPEQVSGSRINILEANHSSKHWVTKG